MTKPLFPGLTGILGVSICICIGRFAVLCYESLWHPVTETTLYIQSQCIRKAFFFPHGIGQGHEPTLSKVDDRRANVSHHVRALHGIVWSSDFSYDSAEVDLDASLGN